MPVPGPLADLAPRAGDVLLFAFRRHLPARHCAIATGDGAMIHAHDGAVVAEVALTGWWRRHVTGVFRFPDVPSGRRGVAESDLRPGRGAHRDRRVDGEQVDLGAPPWRR